MAKQEEFTDLEIRDYSNLEKSFLKSESILKKNYLNNLGTFDLVSSDRVMHDFAIQNYVRLFEITKLVYNKKEDFIEKLTTVTRTAYVCNCTLVTIIVGKDDGIHYYLGIANKNSSSDDTSNFAQAVCGSVYGNFNGSEAATVYNDNLNTIIEDISEDGKFSVVSSVSAIPSLRDDKLKGEEFIQGIENLADALVGRSFIIINIADSVSNDICSNVQDSLEQLYSQLSGFAKTDMSMNENTTLTNSSQYTQSFTETIGTNTSVSQSHTSQTGWSTSETTNESRTRNYGAVAVALAGVAAVGLTVATGGLAAVAGAAVAGAAAAGTAGAGTVAALGISAAGGVAGGLLGSKTKGNSNTSAKSGSDADMEQKQQGEHQDKAKQKGSSTGVSKSLGNGRTLSFSVENRSVKSILDTIDTQLERLKECGSYGSFSSCTYVLTEDIETNTLASSMYCALICGEKSSVQTSKVNTWGLNDDEKNDVNGIKKYLSKFTHPLFEDSSKEYEFTPAVLVSGKELSIQLGFPKRSINGLTVVFKTPFGRNINAHKTADYLPVRVGDMYHMGKKERGSMVDLDKSSLTSHVLITGSTGTGKSNTVYTLLNNLVGTDEKIRFMVVEPAKGEYKHAFYNHPRIKTEVYGTNPQITKLLRINPFSFPTGIHVLEHIDRLVEIMNVCWPMYAAMPAILKNAIIKSYEKCGWDLVNSRNRKGKNYYPSFFDVLGNIREILKSSAYSDDNKGDYTGALCTRVESLTNGIYGQIFTAHELTNTELFENNVIIDLSRCGASETKAMIMGILVMKLQEYRMSSNTAPNSKLKHITVLEEAHNILKRTSTEQSSETANLVGKSVEMISNAIAEMRTFGESFFIVDQAPGLLDRSSIRNTNTKIVLKLPEGEDRELVGKSMALSDDQVGELAKLERGVAAVYQNNWEEAVLCAFPEYHKDEVNLDLDKQLYFYDNTELIKTNSEIKKEIIMDLIRMCESKEQKHSMSDWEEDVDSLPVRIETRIGLRELLHCQKQPKIADIAPVVYQLYDCERALRLAKNAVDMKEWNSIVLNAIDPELVRMNSSFIELFMQCVIIGESKLHPENLRFAEEWVDQNRSVEKCTN